MTNKPLISIVIPCFNREALIADTLDSLIGQTYIYWEALVVDDGSTDQTEFIVKEYVKRDNRIRFLKREVSAKGAPVCRNIGVENAQGEYIIFLDSDDLLETFCLQERVKWMERELDFAVFPGFIFYEKKYDSNVLINVFTKTDDLQRFLDQDTPWLIHNCLWNTDTLKDSLYWDERLSCYQDFHFHLLALLKDLKYKKFNVTPDCFWRRHKGDSISKNTANIQCIFSLKLILDFVSLHLLKQNRLNEQIKRSLITSYLDIVHRYNSINEKSSAINLWSELYNQQIISFKKWVEGIIYIYLYSYSSRFLFFNKAIKKLFFIYWGKSFYTKSYGTFCRVKFK